MTQRRYMPINGELTDAMKGQDTSITGNWTFTQPLTVDCTSGEKLVLRDNSDGVAASNFIRWEQDDETSQGYIGFGSAVTDVLTLSNEKTGGDIQFLTTTGGDVLASCGATGAIEVTGSSYKTNPTGMRIGQYDSGTGYIQVPGNGKVDIWNGGTGAIARFQETGKQTHLYGNLTINQGNGEAITILAGSTGSAMNAWIQFDESDNSRAGFIGYGSSGNTQLFLWNDIGDLFLQAGSGNPGQFKIFEDVLVADDATATWSSPSSTAHGIWMIKNSWDDSGDGMFAHTSQSVTQWAGGSNFQLGDNGTNPNVDGDINAYMSNNYTLSVKNRTGGTRRIVVFYFGGG